MYQQEQYLGRFSTGIINASIMWLYTSDGTEIKAYGLGYLLELAQLFNATEPRDKVYGILGMASLAGHKDLLPDYNKPLREVYELATRMSIEDSGILDILRLARVLGPPDDRRYVESSRWPSWVPLWDEKWDQKVSPMNMPRFFCVNSAIPLALDASASASMLRVQGVIVDTVDAVSESFGYDEKYWTLDHAAGLVRSIWPLVTKTTSDVTGERILGALAECLTMGVDEDYNLVSAEASELNLAALMNERSGGLAGLELSLSLRSKVAVGHGDSEAYTKSFRRHAQHRCFSKTATGFMGLGPRDMQPNDRVCILFGGRNPFLLRENGPR